jgi:predicted transcriptional regulator
MLRLSFPLGRIMGVEIRLHLSFIVLLFAALAYGAAASDNAFRGLGLFAALIFAVAVREIARCIAAAYAGLQLRALFLLPVGGVMAFASQEGTTQPSTLPLLFAAPAANFVVGLLLMGISYACAPGINLLSQPWLSPGHVLRAFVWMQFAMGAVNLLPTATLPTRQMLRTAAKFGGKTETPTVRSSGPAFSVLTGLAIAMLVGGIITLNLWFIILGCFALLGSQLQSQTASDATSPDAMRVDEVMLTEFITLSSSDTLRGALDRTVHSLQDVFPVVRGNRLVGSITRQTLADQLQTEGDSYVQGSMTRSLQVAGPHEQLVLALRRAGSHGASEFIPVAEEGRVLGILTPQSLTRAVHQVKQTRPPVEAREPR